MNRRDFIAGAVGGFIVGAGIGYAVGRRRPTAETTPAETQSGALAPERSRGSPLGKAAEPARVPS